MERDMQELHDTTNKCCEILQRTNDGDDLDPLHLKLTELAINGFLSEAGREAFETLHKQVMAGEYTKPYFHDVEPMTRDHEGYIYYKNICVEHYSSGWAYTLHAKNQLLRLKSKCEFLENNGVPPNHVSALGVEYGTEKTAQFYALLEQHGDGAGLSFAYVSVHNNYGREIGYLTFAPVTAQSVKTNEMVRDFRRRLDNDGFVVTVQNFHIGGEREIQDERLLDALLYCFNYWKNQELITPLSTQKWAMTEAEILKASEPKAARKGKKPRRQER